ncbi:hypothetical protein, partial [Micromonospora sp. ATA51]|uniref:hypothetical protein n=1 Tax=Micromonospora sp. ATA51 TaxID=2806098 RepID=UPI001EE3D653
AVVYVGEDRIPRRVADSFGEFIDGLVSCEVYEEPTNPATTVVAAARSRRTSPTVAALRGRLPAPPPLLCFNQRNNPLTSASSSAAGDGQGVPATLRECCLKQSKGRP